MKTSSKVPIGLATLFGYGIALAGFVSYIVTTLTASQAQIEGPGKTVLILSTVITSLIGAGRQLQASGIKLPTGARAVLDELPSLEEELMDQPPAPGTLDALSGTIAAAGPLVSASRPDVGQG